jgi:hypothetical protein
MSLNFRRAPGLATQLPKPVHIGFHFSPLSRNARDVLFVPLITAPEVPCPLWLISVIEAPSPDVRFTPQKRTLDQHCAMSAMCQK